MLSRRYRVVVEIELTMTEVRLESIRERRRRFELEMGEEPHSARVLPSESEVAHQRALQEQLLAMPEVLERWWRRALLVELAHGGLGEERLREIEEREYVSEEDLLRPVIERLPPASRHKFRQASADQSLVDAAEELYESLEGRTISVTIVDA